MRGAGFILLLLAFAMGGRRRGNGNGSGNGNGTGQLNATPNIPRPAGDPPAYGDGPSCETYSGEFYPTVASVKDRFAGLGYPVPDRPTMNDPGPDGSLGGNDDLPSQSVLEFQEEYNVASSGGFLGPAGGLDMDGFVGPCTLNALQHVYTIFGGGPDFRSEILTG